jgi:predicted DNA-binding ribbon-helix-helix protein
MRIPNAQKKNRRKKNNQSVLVCRNVTVNGRRTSLRMEPLLWDSLKDIAERENLSINQVCSEIDRRREAANLTAALRVFIISYYRNAAPAGPGGFDEESAPGFAQGDSPLLRRALAEAIPLDE